MIEKFLPQSPQGEQNDPEARKKMPQESEVLESEVHISPEYRDQIVMAVENKLESEMIRLHGEEPFHNPQHPEHVWEDAKSILEIFAKYTDKITPDVHLATETGIKGHDVIIEYTVVQDPKAWNYGQRVRHRGFGDRIPSAVSALPGVRTVEGRKVGNEEASWLLIQEIIREKDPKGEIYTPAMMQIIKDEVAATYTDAIPATFRAEATKVRDPKTGEMVDLAPYLDKDKEGRSSGLKFMQPFLTPESHPAVLATAFGDLKYGGRSSFPEFKDRGDEEYRELNELISNQIAGGISKLTPEQRAAIAKSMLGWMHSEVGFLLWQKEDFIDKAENSEAIEQSTDPEALKRELYAAYGNFDENVLASVKHYDETREKFGNLTTPEVYTERAQESTNLLIRLLKEMGYQEQEIQ